MTTPAPGSMLEDIQLKLANGAVAEAGAVIDGLWADFSDDPNLGYLKALYYRLSNQPSQALRLLTDLTKRYPDMARAHQETALNALSLNEPKAALRAAEFAVTLDASLLRAWELLEPLHRAFAPEKLGSTQDQIRFLKSLPTELRTVIGYLTAGKLQDAERLCKYFLRENKTHAEGMRLLAEILTRKNILDEAQFILETLRELEPDHLPAAIQLFHVVMRRQRFHSAFEIARTLKHQHPSDEDQIKKAYAAACFAIGRITEAEELYQQLRQQFPSDHLIPISQGHIFNAKGDREAAVESFMASASIKVDHGDAYWSLANTKSYRFEETQIQKMRELEQRSDIGELDRIQICFALGKASEDTGLYEEAFEYYARGNQLKLPSTHFDIQQLTKRVDAQIAVCTPDLFTSLAETGLAAPDPIFIVGLPRAGSTLLEQILASHSQIDGTMELHNILDLAKRLRGRDSGAESEPRYPRILGELERAMFERFGQQFIDETRVYRSNAPHFIDKMPNNFFHIGLIKLILPNAKIIDARRHPMACCFSGFKQLWGEGQEFSYGLEQIGSYYRQYVRLMRHWDEVLPDFVLRVQHEDVVEDLEKQVRRLLDFCGLPFEPACLDFHKTDRTVRTPSAEQVRQPIYRSGLDQWRNFEQYLDPLKQALGEELLESYGIAPPQ